MVCLKKKHEKKLLLGIDLGTTYSLVATVINNNATLLLDDKKRYLLPSIVNYKKNSITVGWDAIKDTVQDPTNTISSVKRLLGRSLSFIKNNFPILPYLIEENEKKGIFFRTDSGCITPVDVSSEILKSLKERAIFLFNQEIHASVITVPAYFNDIQKKETQRAAILAKINLIKLLNEPTAAAFAYNLQIQKKEIIFVYDLGGGTFDISILKLHKGMFEVLASSGDTHLGGDDFDYVLANYIYKKSNLLNKYNIILQSKLLKIAKLTKIKLTEYKKVKVNFLNWEGYITRDEFNSIILSFVQKTLFICSDLLEEINLSIEKIAEVIMVGGSTRVPLVHDQVAHFFKKKLLNDINPDQVVAIGAALHANMLINNNIKNKIILLDVIPLSLGIEVMGGFVEKIILRNTTLPVIKTKEFTTYKDNQTSILIHVVQGERELVKDCISLSRFVLKNIIPQKAGLVRISVTFQVNTDGLINISVLDKNSNQEKKVQINNTVLTKIDTTKIIKNSLKHLKDDYYLRVKEEKKMESLRVLNIVNNALIKYQHSIPFEELKKIKFFQEKLKESIEKDDFFAIKENLKKLDAASINFFSLQLKNTIRCSSIKNILKEDV
ncbi:Fe-S protein assembly chaperone HscA [Buchnera aphidicola]|uniref:Chaperone protein HscA n=1 Tax=Buchnera aphidicola subsp. Uroleucon sonchi TaxID=118118 RepID=A0A6C1FIH0_BUCUN|nr:Fe-S protein assembly chaperone HscA [Buchnera aphidicola]QIE02265.1 Fe-S protein assembly chaperone HscA [Buchnera aphidicola (Uroleucon sonchi)]